MQKYLNSPIKETITGFPEVGKILEEYKIGCVPCTLGSCLLKEIVKIHNLSEHEEAEMMYRIEKAIYPEREIKKPEAKTAKKEPAGKIKYSPPVARLVEEHTLIKKWLAMVPRVIETADPASPGGRQLVSDGLDFIRFYADKFHHAKEEDILFKYADRNSDIIKTILADHETARGYVRAARAALETGDKTTVFENLAAYKMLLSEHIKKEDEILYPWIDRGLSLTSVGELFTRFNAAEEKIAEGVVKKCLKFIAEIEERLENIE